MIEVIGSKVEAAYRRGDLCEERRRLMEAWAGFCEAPAEGKVIAIHPRSTELSVIQPDS